MDIRENISLSKYTTLKTGGPARYFAAVTTSAELEKALVFTKEKDCPYFVLGGGSNVLFPDEGFDGLVILNKILGRKFEDVGDDTLVKIGAGEVFDDVVLESVVKGLWGLENLSHIPGSVGATPVQNVGAYGVEVSDLITEVIAYDTQLEKKVSFTKQECNFTYRDSLFKRAPGRYIILEVTYTLSKTPAPKIVYKDLIERLSKNQNDIKKIRETIISIRSKKFPDWNEVGTAGSFFKNPFISVDQYNELLEKYPDIPGFVDENDRVKVPAGWILDHVCSMRGVKKGNVGTYHGQALVLIAEGNATTSEIINFKNELVENVKEKTGITFEPEVTIVEK